MCVLSCRSSACTLPTCVLRGPASTQVDDPQTHQGRMLALVRSYLLPQGFPDSVAPQYASYMGWRGVQYFFGGAMSVFTTKCLLTSLGVAGRHSVSSTPVDQHRPQRAAQQRSLQRHAATTPACLPGCCTHPRHAPAQASACNQRVRAFVIATLCVSCALLVLCVCPAGRGCCCNQLGAQGRRWAAGPLPVCALGP